jgi:hypothetical protein
VRIDELIHSQYNTPETNLTTALELLRYRYADKDQTPVISTQALINLVLNTDKTFNYDALKAAYENNPSVKNLIKSFNKQQVTLQPLDASDETNTTVGDASTTAPVDTVSKMAKRAAKSRGSDLF